MSDLVERLDRLKIDGDDGEDESTTVPAPALATAPATAPAIVPAPVLDRVCSVEAELTAQKLRGDAMDIMLLNTLKPLMDKVEELKKEVTDLKQSSLVLWTALPEDLYPHECPTCDKLFIATDCRDDLCEYCGVPYCENCRNNDPDGKLCGAYYYCMDCRIHPDSKPFFEEAIMELGAVKCSMCLKWCREVEDDLC